MNVVGAVVHVLMWLLYTRSHSAAILKFTQTLIVKLESSGQAREAHIGYMYLHATSPSQSYYKHASLS